jgi:N-acylneuraminate cytidylyltransferase
MKKNLTIIPARGGSKTIPQKNLQIINGKSLIERSVLSALKIENNLVVVSTDDIEIREIVKDYPVRVSTRSKVNASDLASSESVVLEVLNEVGVFDGVIVLLQATSPFVDIDGLKTAINTLHNTDKVDSMFSAVLKNEFIWEFENQWEPKNHSKNLRLPRQLRPPTAVETGSFYIFKAKKFLNEKSRFCGTTSPALTKSWSNFDIDNQEDLDFCRELSKVLDFPPYLA